MNHNIKLLLLPICFLLTLANAKAQFCTSWQDSLYWFNPIEEKQIKEKPVILEFWATWCGACIEAMPYINQLTENYKQDITFLSVNSYDTKYRIDRFLEKQEMLSCVVLDENKYLANLMEVENLPVTILLDKNGRIRWRGVPSELTSNMLNEFISNNSISEKPTSGVIVDTILTLSESREVSFSLNLDYGDLTKGKGMMTSDKDGFFLGLLNRPIENLLSNIYTKLAVDGEIRFEGNIPKGLAFNLRAEGEAYEADHAILEEIVNHLSMVLGFSVFPIEDIQTVWFLESEKNKENPLISKYSTDDPSMKKVVKDIVFTNFPTKYIADILGRQVNEKMKCNFEPDTGYDFIIPDTGDILKLKSYLKDKYDINLIEKQIEVKVNKVVFH